MAVPVPVRREPVHSNREVLTGVTVRSPDPPAGAGGVQTNTVHLPNHAKVPTHGSKGHRLPSHRHRASCTLVSPAGHGHPRNLPVRLISPKNAKHRLTQTQPRPRPPLDSSPLTVLLPAHRLVARHAPSMYARRSRRSRSRARSLRRDDARANENENENENESENESESESENESESESENEQRRSGRCII